MKVLLSCLFFLTVLCSTGSAQNKIIPKSQRPNSFNQQPTDTLSKYLTPQSNASQSLALKKLLQKLDADTLTHSEIEIHLDPSITGYFTQKIGQDQMRIYVPQGSYHLRSFEPYTSKRYTLLLKEY